MEDKITLDREAFRVLASDTRITILKSLDQRRKMLTELSNELKMSPSTVKEHMEGLCTAGLTVQIDDGHKWKYYELTRKGKGILHPGDTRIWVMLSVCIIAMVGIFYDMSYNPSGSLMAGANAPDMLQVAPAMKSLESAPAAGIIEETGSQTIQSLPLFHISALVAAAIVMGACIAYLAISRKRLMVRI